MSSDSTNQLLNYFKQLVKQLDNKFSSLEKQLDTIEANLDNLRSFNERYQNQVASELKSLRQAIVEQSNQAFTGSKELPEIDTLLEPIQNETKPTPTSSPVFKPIPPPVGPPPIDQQKQPDSRIQSGFSAPESERISEPIPQTPVVKPSKGIESQYGGYKETPILEALREESIDDSNSYESLSQKKKAKKQALQGYLEKLEKVINASLPIAEENLTNENYQGFLDKGLTVVHGIIEFLFVAYRLEFPDSSLDYYSKAKNLSGQGLFKDVSLLEKLESLYAQIESNEKPVLARPLLRGFNERILKLNEDFESKLLEAYARL